VAIATEKPQDSISSILDRTQ